jgi:hypothetical protein
VNIAQAAAQTALNSKAPALAQVLERVGNTKSNEVTPDILMQISKVFGQTPSRALLADMSAVIQSGSEDTLAGWLGQPDNIRTLVSWFLPENSDPWTVLDCPACHQAILVETKKLESARPGDTISMQCPHCTKTLSVRSA